MNQPNNDTAGWPAQAPVAFADMTRDNQIMAWQAKKKELDAAKAEEMAMRKHIVESNSHGFDTETIGTQNVDLGNGWTLKAVVKQSFTLDTDNDKVEAALDRLEDWQADRLVKWSPRMMKKEYDDLDAADRDAFNEVVTISTASPTLTLVAPKGA